MGIYGLVPGAKPKSVSKSYPCPLCKHTDWCMMFCPDDYPDGVIYGCQRVEMPRGTKFESEGITYIVVGQTKNQATTFEPIEQHAYRRPNSPLLKGEKVNTKGMKVTQRQYTYEEEVKPFSAPKRNEIYRAMLGMLKLDEEDRKYLLSEGFTDEYMDKYLIRSFPEPDGYRFNNRNYHSASPYRTSLGEELAKKFGSLEGVPGAYRNSKGKWTFAGLGGILFPITDMDGNIVLLRIRVRRRWYDGEGKDISKAKYDELKSLAKAANRHCDATELGKYMYLSSYKEDAQKMKDGIVANRYPGGCSGGICLGFYKPLGTWSKGTMFITEGEKKSIITANKLRVMCVNTPGVGLWRPLFEEREDGTKQIDQLRSMGWTSIIVAFDADKEFNEAVLKQEEGLKEELKKAGFRVGVAAWDINKGKGLDDLLNHGYMPEIEYLK